jgi:hypothetical protein
MKTLLFVVILFTAFTTLAFWCVWQNRASEKVLQFVIPIYASAVIGILLTTFLATIAPISAVIPVGFIYDSITRIPFFIQQRRVGPMEFLPGQVPEAERVKLGFHDDAKFFHQVLQAAIIDELGLYFRPTWLPAITRVEIGGGGMTRFQGGTGFPAGTILDTKALDDRLKGNRFAGLRAGIPPQIVLPPGTEMIVVIPDDSKPGEIVFKKRGFFDLRIETSFESTGVGLGPYTFFSEKSQDELQRLYRSSNYLIKINADFNGRKSGHPNMQNYRDWADKVIEVLRKGFDEQEIYNRTKDAIVLRKQLGK